MPKISAGLLMYRLHEGKLQVLLVHPGGPFWKNKDSAAWSIPKGLAAPGEDPLAAARREFHEETGFDAAEPFIPLAPVKQPGGKVIRAWAFESDCDPAQVKGNYFTMEWPPRSGRFEDFPEIDRAEWFDIKEAKIKIHKGQRALLEDLSAKIGFISG